MHDYGGMITRSEGRSGKPDLGICQHKGEDDHNPEEYRTIGFVKPEHGRYGGSPDRLIGEDGILEAKSPKPNTHVGYMLDPLSLTSAYKVQTHAMPKFKPIDAWAEVNEFGEIVWTMERGVHIFTFQIRPQWLPVRITAHQVRPQGAFEGGSAPKTQRRATVRKEK